MQDKRIRQIAVCGSIIGAYLLADWVFKKRLNKLLDKIVSTKRSLQINAGKQQYLEEQAAINQQQFPRVKICLTGGPCGGKTQGLLFLQQKLRELGYTVYVIPESATIIGSGGGFVNMAEYTEEMVLLFQINLMLMQTNLEDRFEQISKLTQNQKAVFLCDRGLMDGKAYMRDRIWDAMLSDFNLNETIICNKRYDAVIHLVTCALGAEEAYNQQNVVRHESIQDARDQDAKTRQVWQSHRNHTIITNENVNFEQKLEILLKTVLDVIENPKPYVEPEPQVSQPLSQILIRTSPGMKSLEKSSSKIHSKAQYELAEALVSNYDNRIIQLRKLSDISEEILVQ